MSGPKQMELREAPIQEQGTPGSRADLDQPIFNVRILTSGRLPVRKSSGAVGYDVAVRAVVCPSLAFDLQDPAMRKTIFDFSLPNSDHPHRGMIEPLSGRGVGGRDEWVWRLDPGKHVFVGLGVIIELDPGWQCYTVPRGSTPNRHYLQVLDVHVPIDPDFRGEPVAHLINRGDRPYSLRHGVSLVQFVFQPVFRPMLRVVGQGEELSNTQRGTNSFGSTGE
ncbi:MAG TPA: hypothetical protein VJJ22_01080 [Candidatus Paceibacterota bacterium]